MEITNLYNNGNYSWTLVETTTSRNNDSAPNFNEFMVSLKSINYGIIHPILITLGVCGNVLHLITLRSPELRTVPFMYIQAVAVFDLLCLILISFCIDRFKRNNPIYTYPITYYQAHFELPLINITLTSGVYTALFLTVERLYILYRPLEARRQSGVIDINNERFKAKLYIFGCLLCSTVLHVPQCFERTPKPAKTGGDRYTVRDNPDFDIRLLKAYRLIRELICRVVPVFLLVVLNVSIVRTMRRVNERRKRLCNQTQTLVATTDVAEESPVKKREVGGGRSFRIFLATFSEKRLTTMMIVISVVYAAGNLPQVVMMYLNSELKSNDVSFQTFRAIANTTEVFHHCINFYIFCLTSRDYLKCFLRLCLNVKKAFAVVCCNRMELRRESTDTETSSAKFRQEFSVVSSPPDEDLVFL